MVMHNMRCLACGELVDVGYDCICIVCRDKEREEWKKRKEVNNMVPTIGRIVHYKSFNDGIRPAIITKVWSEDCVNLQIFLDGSLDAAVSQSPVLIQTSVLQGDATGQWQWPVKEAA